MSKGHTRTEPRHVRLYYHMLKTEAWKGMGAVPKALYVDICTRYNGSNNGRVPYSVREGAKAMRVGKTTAAEGLQVLVDRGFIKIATRGAFSLKTKHATQWLLTAYPTDSQPIAPRDYQNWVPEKTTVPEGGLSVPEGGPSGTRGRTVAA